MCFQLCRARARARAFRSCSQMHLYLFIYLRSCLHLHCILVLCQNAKKLDPWFMPHDMSHNHLPPLLANLPASVLLENWNGSRHSFHFELLYNQHQGTNFKISCFFNDEGRHRHNNTKCILNDNNGRDLNTFEYLSRLGFWQK